MALYAVLKKFEALDAKSNRAFLGPKASEILKPNNHIIQQQSNSNSKSKSTKTQRRPFSAGRQRSSTTNNTKSTRTRRPSSAGGHRQRSTTSTTKSSRTRPKSAMSRMRTTSFNFSSSSFNKQKLTAGLKTTDHFDSKFYFLRISLGHNQIATKVNVTVTDLTSPDRPVHTYRNLNVNKQKHILFRDTPLFGCGKKSLTVISPVDDFHFITSPAQLLGHTLRILVESISPQHKFLVDTCAHFAGRNQGSSVLLARSRRSIQLKTKSTKSASTSVLDQRAQKENNSNKTLKEQRIKKWKEEQRNRLKTNATTESSSLEQQIENEIEKRKRTTHSKEKIKSPKRKELKHVTLHNNSPNFRTRQIPRPRKKRPVLSPRTNHTTSSDVSYPIDSPKTELANMRKNLSLNISKFKDQVNRKRQQVMTQATASVTSNGGNMSSKLSPELKPRLTPYMKYDVDPDAILRELSSIDSSAANQGLKGWSPTHSRRKPNGMKNGVEGSSHHYSQKMEDVDTSTNSCSKRRK